MDKPKRTNSKKPRQSSYDDARERPETLAELITDFCDFKREIHRLIREANAKIDALQGNYKFTNERQEKHQQDYVHVLIRRNKELEPME